MLISLIIDQLLIFSLCSVFFCPLVDYFYSKGNRRIFGPTRNASVLEGDKFYSHNLMDRLKVPQAYGICCSFDDNPIQAIANVSSSSKNGGVVIKARGKFISKAVDIAEVARKRFLADLKIVPYKILIESEDFTNKEGRQVRVSTIDIHLKKE